MCCVATESLSGNAATATPSRTPLAHTHVLYSTCAVKGVGVPVSGGVMHDLSQQGLKINVHRVGLNIQNEVQKVIGIRQAPRDAAAPPSLAARLRQI